MPVRSFETVASFEEATKDAEELIIDGFENPKERKKAYKAQKEDYSGKKKCHTDIGLCISDKDKYIYFLSYYYPGKNVDYSILKKEFPPEQDWLRLVQIEANISRFRLCWLGQRLRMFRIIFGT